MPKTYSAREILNALKRLGFQVKSQKGSHIKVIKIIDNQTFSAIIPDHKEIATGTLNSILKQANVTREELEAKI